MAEKNENNKDSQKGQVTLKKYLKKEKPIKNCLRTKLTMMRKNESKDLTYFGSPGSSLSKVNSTLLEVSSTWLCERKKDYDEED